MISCFVVIFVICGKTNGTLPYLMSWFGNLFAFFGIGDMLIADNGQWSVRRECRCVSEVNYPTSRQKGFGVNREFGPPENRSLSSGTGAGRPPAGLWPGNGKFLRVRRPLSRSSRRRRKWFHRRWKPPRWTGENENFLISLSSLHLLLFVFN